MDLHRDFLLPVIMTHVNVGGKKTFGTQKLDGGTLLTECWEFGYCVVCCYLHGLPT